VQEKVFEGGVDIVSPTRMVVKRGKVKLISQNTFGSGHSADKVVLVLLNDMLLFGEGGGKLTKGKCRAALQLGLMVAEPLANQAASAKTYADLEIACCFILKTPQHKPFIFQCDTPEVSAQWIQSLQQTVERYTRNLDRSVLMDQVMMSCLSAEDFEKVSP
jgi:hypothetical protein